MQLEKFILMTPLKIECELMVKALQGLNYKNRIFEYKNKQIYSFNELPFVLTWGGFGKAAFASHTVDVIHHYQQDLSFILKAGLKGFICCGSSGALSEDLQIGDVVIGLKTIEHDFKSVFQNFKPPTYIAPLLFTDLFSLDSSQDSNFKVLLGSIASGDEDILNRNRANEILKDTSAIVTAWEGAGGAKACELMNLPYLEVRSVTDLCDSNSMTDFKLNLKLAMTNLVLTLLKYLPKK